MDQFEIARQKYEKKTLHLKPVTSTEEVTLPPVPAILIPKEKRQSSDAVIKVTVVLPDGEFSFQLVKEMIYQNMNRSAVNASEFRRAMQEGLRKFMGEVK